jgi:hypothetical protein
MPHHQSHLVLVAYKPNVEQRSPYALPHEILNLRLKAHSQAARGAPLRQEEFSDLPNNVATWQRRERDTIPKPSA